MGGIPGLAASSVLRIFGEWFCAMASVSRTPARSRASSSVVSPESKSVSGICCQ